MWAMTKHGFFSIVKKDGGWHVRARVVNDLKLLQKAVGGRFSKMIIHLTPEADYCARVFVPEEPLGREVIGSVMMTFAESVDYGNFKTMIGESDSQRHKLHAYHGVWGELYAVQEEMRVKRIAPKRKHALGAR